MRFACTLHRRGYEGYLANENRLIEDLNAVEDDVAYLREILDEVAEK